MSDHPDPPDDSCYFPDCTRRATHKIGEEAPLCLHNMTTYLCCDHMRALAMNCSAYPYAAALTDPFAFLNEPTDPGTTP